MAKWVSDSIVSNVKRYKQSQILVKRLDLVPLQYWMEYTLAFTFLPPHRFF